MTDTMKTRLQELLAKYFATHDLTWREDEELDALLSAAAAS